MTVKAGDQLVGLRVSTPDLADAARSVLAPALVAGVVAPPNVSVLATEAHAGSGLLFCYRSSAAVTRARSPRRALEAVVTLISSFTPSAPGAAPRIPAVVALGSGRAVLLCPASRMVIDRLAPRLRRDGWELVDLPWAEIDPTSGHVIIAEPAVAVDTAALSRLPLRRGDGRPPAPGRYPVAAWVDLAGDGPEPSTLAARVAVVAAAADLDAATAATTIEAVAAMLDRAAWATSASLDAGALAQAVASATAR
ncbi:MAG TPA: hypothetical protein VG184_06805 [Acidimicrobiales bacterium]|jgi:hypothetical protein|nr:hypothetical protein [Acidimicrobiales bacterium]